MPILQSARLRLGHVGLSAGLSKEKEVCRGRSVCGTLSCSGRSSANSRGTVLWYPDCTLRLFCVPAFKYGRAWSLPASWVDSLVVVTFRQKGVEVCSTVGQRGKSSEAGQACCGVETRRLLEWVKTTTRLAFQIG